MARLDQTPGRAAVLWTGVAAVLGAGAMYLGDQLMFGFAGPGSAPWDAAVAAMVRHAPGRLTLGGGLAVPAGIGYLLGLVHLAGRLEPAPRWADAAVRGLLFAAFVTAVCIHAAWGAYALTVKAAVGDLGAPAVLVLRDYLDAFRPIAVATSMAGCLGLAALTLLGRTRWPRGFVIANPAVLYTALGAATFLPAPIGAAVVNGGFNLAFCLFFLASLLVSLRPEPAA